MLVNIVNKTADDEKGTLYGVWFRKDFSDDENFGCRSYSFTVLHKFYTI